MTLAHKLFSSSKRSVAASGLTPSGGAGLFSAATNISSRKATSSGAIAQSAVSKAAASS
ncbi:Hypothetical protein A7982_10517 [Minicystis rosea]|nr:Hypothetical protein A7982_10517 [Minicystis rosea]